MTRKEKNMKRKLSRVHKYEQKRRERDYLKLLLFNLIVSIACASGSKAIEWLLDKLFG